MVVAAEPKKTKTPAVNKVAASATENEPAAMTAEHTMGKPTATRKKAAKPNPEALYRMVETAAYFIAEQRGFEGHPHDHWAAAEREIASRLNP